MCEVSLLHFLVVEFKFINLWLTIRQVCQIRPKAQKAGKIYPTCGFKCAAFLTSSSTSKGDIPTVDPLVKSFQKLSLPNHNPGTHYSPQQSSRTDRHGQHSSYGHSQSPRGVTRRQPEAAPADRHSLTQVHQSLKCVVCFLLPSSDLSRQILHSVTGLPEALSRWEICHMWDEMCRNVVHTGKP